MPIYPPHHPGCQELGDAQRRCWHWNERKKERLVTLVRIKYNFLGFFFLKHDFFFFNISQQKQLNKPVLHIQESASIATKKTTTVT